MAMRLRLERQSKERANALFSRLPPGTPFDRRKQLMEFATKNRLPVASGQNLDTEAGGIMFYGWDRRDLYRRAATYVDKILRCKARKSSC
jgi:hypothetical protein